MRSCVMYITKESSPADASEQLLRASWVKIQHGLLEDCKRNRDSDESDDDDVGESKGLTSK